MHTKKEIGGGRRNCKQYILILEKQVSVREREGTSTKIAEKEKKEDRDILLSCFPFFFFLAGEWWEDEKQRGVLGII
jgi:hypothetical protein